MFTHGRVTWGNIGCVDLTYRNDSFAGVIRPMTSCHIPLTVAYNGAKTLPPPP